MLAELLLSYQKRASELQVKQDPFRRRIRAHAAAMQEAVSRIQGIATEQVAEFTTELQQLTSRADELRDDLHRLERQVLSDAPQDNDLLGETDPDAGKIDAEETPQEKLSQAQDLLTQEVDVGSLRGLRRCCSRARRRRSSRAAGGWRDRRT